MAEESSLNGQNNSAQTNGMDFENDNGGSSSNALRELSQEAIESLQKEAREAKTLFDQFDVEFNNPENTSFYVISQQWLNKWKQYVSYDNVTQDLEPNVQYFGQSHPGKINEDLIDDNPKFIPLSTYPEDKSFTNVLLRDGLQEGRDYKLITEAAWNYLYNDYQGVTIKRPCRVFPNGEKQVEVRLKKIQIVPVNNAFLRSIDHDRVREFKVFVFQAPSFKKLTDFKSDLVDVCNSTVGKKWFESTSPIYSTYSVYSEDTIRFWKLELESSLSDMFTYTKSKCKRSTSYEYRIDFKGTYLLKDPEISLDEAEIADSDFVFLEVREQGRGWNFLGDGAIAIDKCEFCNKYEELPIKCGCDKVRYCSEECKFKDKRFHQSKCDKAGEEEEAQRPLSLTAASKRGLCGLQNLGNTCFMNSGLQCLSNVVDLTEYFLSDKYLKELNETNPLGTKGKLVKKYGTFIKSLWFGISTVQSPWSLKHGISEFQPMFSGYQQHDSQELLAFLLDGLHEDLNRVKVKPFTETIESNEQADYEVGLRSWENHLKRNQSIIVDLLHGQFKSKITCPTCDRVSITFDPFNSVSLPIPAKIEKEIDFFFMFANNKEKPIKLVVRYPTHSHTVTQLKKDTAKLLNKDPNSFYFVFSSQHSKEVITDEDKTLTNTLRKKRKIRPLFAFEVAEEDLKANPEERINVDYQTSKKVINYFGRPTRKKFTYPRTVSLRKNFTARDAYIKIFQQYRTLWEEAATEEESEDWKKLSNEEAFAKAWESEETKPFRIHLVTNARIFHECYFCGEKRCENCELKCDENLRISDLVEKIKDPEFNLEFEVFFEDLPENVDLERLNSYTDLSKTKEDDEEEKKNNINIYQCFEQFEEPEILGEENAWYCSNCKQHQRATKRMEIFKAPPILMIHLKRFKSGATSFASKSKISAKVDFPLVNFDIGEYVLNHELPMDYPVERITPGYRTEGANGETAQEGSTNVDSAGISDSNIIQPENEGQIQNGKEGMDVEVNSQSKNETIDEEAVNEKGDGKHLLYDLFAVVNHYGNLGFGHYTANGKNHVTNKWYNFDDSSVSEENSNNICTPASYVLFYKRKNWTFST